MNTAHRSISLHPNGDSKDSKKPAPSGQYRMVQPRSDSRMPAPLPARRARAHNNSEYLDPKDGAFAVPVNGATVKSLPVPAKAAPTKSSPVKSAKPKAVSLVALDDAFDDESKHELAGGPAKALELDDAFDADDPADAPDSLVQMMDGLEGAKIKEEAAWPKQMPVVPKPPSVPKMEAIRPIQPPISKLTPGPVNEHQVIGEFAKFGPPPATIWQTVGYMFHVRARKEQLRQELGLHRQRRASDVDLYEKALRHIDEEAVRRGYMMLGGGALMGVLVIVMICVLL